MNNMQILERLISVKNNAYRRSSEESSGITNYTYQVRASLLESGINQLIIEIQNTMLAEYRRHKNDITRKRMDNV